jgi:hypothetical protein
LASLWNVVCAVILKLINTAKCPITINATNEMHHDERIALSLVPVEDGITLVLKR